ncbi:FxDxF family PEP-CTERM protein [Methylophilus methylotrophus]|uniref:FxDxF family PEP-CTERM protein n=1 Tax=Methylophilus methylotrophus TaxID=17 RepID=UPI0003621C9F|nr:FxDxF family PEP-CTERM protein [Methylophilus methylotrophus]
MKKTALLIAFGLSTLFINPSYAATYEATQAGGGYVFSNSFSGNTSFDDYIAFSTDGLQQVLASVSGTGATFNLQEFNLLDENKNLVMNGSVFNSGSTNLSFGFANSIQQGSYYLQVVGESSGTNASYAGTITLANAVPEPETMALMLSGLGLIGVAGRRKMREKV